MPLIQPQLSKNQYVRLSQIVGDPEADPPIEPLIPVSRSTIYRLISQGKFPQPKKLSSGTSLWSLREVYECMEQLGVECHDE